MGRTVGIDLGTTNSEVAIVENGQARVLPGEEGDLILPSCVGFSDTGKLLVGRDALRQYAAAPDRTVRSIKRWMGTDHKTTLRIDSASDETREYLPHEISAMILRALKQRAETALGEEVTQAVITVPAYFTDAQRQATKTAGEIAGLEVLQIINEPTAAALTYDLRSDETEQVLVYDLGGGTFDVSVVEITGEVTEVLASHGNNQLGGDDFDRRLQLHLAERFRQAHGIDVPEDAVTQARLLRAAEQVKITLSTHGFAPVREAFLGSKGNTALHLEAEISRSDFEELLRPLLEETLEAIDRALADAELDPEDLDRIILVGGSTRIPLVQQMVEEHLDQAPVDGVQPDLCVALGAALQAGVLAGEEVESILVDVIPHSLGISAAVSTPMGIMPGFFSVIIPRNSVVPVSRSEIYSTMSDRQTAVEIEIFQGENEIAEENVPLGSYKVEGLPPGAAGSIQIEVHFDFDINGILTVTTTEKGKGQQGTLVVNHGGIERLSSHELKQARADLDALFQDGLFQPDETLLSSAASDVEDDSIDVETSETIPIAPELVALLTRARQALDTLEGEQVEELQDLLDDIAEAIADSETELIANLQEELADFLYYATTQDS
ncbi:MAG: Hsp70 family protein [Drouetiella hepatica Uher 2000/2452]|jgi:molecular chaperone DnaK|uniref:Hsp70 family protein n=1 Tax=Drouetiella hepatica Uher 2000/2452 TaxID=904376 RepID=A0A951Q9A4_9CYAN|nr:Hsp70 family protein [Drouetiella hepatica Uher 2000/2452]